MVFMTIDEVEAVLNGTTKDVFKISEVVNRLRTSRVLYDTDKMLQTWQENVKNYVWADDVINSVKRLAFDELTNARRFLREEDFASAIYELRSGLQYLGKVTVMKNNIFTMLKPAEVLTEVRMLDPMTYKLFLRTYKLKGMSDTKLLVILNEMNDWFAKTELKLEEVTEDSRVLEVTRLLAQAQREHHGALGLTYAGDLELAVLEMRQATCTLGRAMVALQGQDTEDVAFIPTLRIGEHEYFNQVLVEYGGYDIMPSEINRIISETEFLAHRI
jgi:hypothetical protein